MDSNLEDQDINSIPIASLSSLPIEIKSIIVNLAKLQDENYKERIKLKNEDESELVKGVLKDNEWRGKSLNALFLVSKQWSNLAAIHIFEILRSKKVDSDVFPFEILPQRGNVIRSVQFNNDSFLPETLLHLAAMPNLQCLEFYDYAVTSLFGALVEPGISGTKKHNFHYSALLAAGRRVKRLHIDAFKVSNLNGILSAFSVLEKLTLALFWNHEDEEDEGDEMLQLGVKLSEYSFECLGIDFNGRNIPEYWTHLDWKSLTSLKRLECSLTNDLTVLDNTFFKFLNRFNSLKYLKLLFYPKNRYSIHSTPTKRLQLTQLTQLNIQCAIVQLSPLLLHFTASPIEVLQFETWQSSKTTGNISSIETSLMQFVDQHQKTLKRIEICDRFTTFSFSTLVTLCSRHLIVLVFTSWIGKYISCKASFVSIQNQFNFCRSILEKALNFGKNKLVELENDDDVEGLKEMFDNCKWLRAGLAEKED